MLLHIETKEWKLLKRTNTILNVFGCFVTSSLLVLFVKIKEGFKLVCSLLGFKLYSDDRSDPYCLARQVKVVELKVTWITKSYSPKGSDSVYPPPSTITQENLCRSGFGLQGFFLFFAALRSEMTLWSSCVGLGQGAAPGVLRPHSEAAGREGPVCFPCQAGRHTYHLRRPRGCPCPAGGPCG